MGLASLVPRPHPLTVKTVWWTKSVFGLVGTFVASRCSKQCHTHKKGAQMYTQERQNVTAARKVLLTQGKYYDCNKLIIVRSYWSLPHFRNVSKSLTNSTFFCSPDHFSPGGACGLDTRLTFCLQFPCTKCRVVHHWLTHGGVGGGVGVWQQGHPLHTHPL